jgi:hypothetical protein
MKNWNGWKWCLLCTWFMLKLRQGIESQEVSLRKRSELVLCTFSMFNCLILERAVSCAHSAGNQSVQVCRSSRHLLLKLWSSYEFVVFRCFGGTYRLHLQGGWIGLAECWKGPLWNSEVPQAWYKQPRFLFSSSEALTGQIPSKLHL